MFRRKGAAILVVLSLCPSILQAGNYNTASLRPILEILSEANLSGSLEFSGRCDMRGFPDFPRFGLTTGEDGAIERLRKGFAGAPELQVLQDSSGTVRMLESSVPVDVLHVKIARVTFEDYDRRPIYSPNGALNVISRSPEVEAFMQSHHIRFLFSASAVIAPTSPPVPDVPHISGVLENTTLSDALDYVLRTFPGVWVYENCPAGNGESRIYLRFYYLRKLSNATFVAE